MFSKKDLLNFDGKFTKNDSLEFLQIFTLRSNNYYTQVDVMNAFRVSCKSLILKVTVKGIC